MLKILKKAVKNDTLSRDREQKFRDYLTKQEFYRTVDDDQTAAYDDTLRYIYTKVCRSVSLCPALLCVFMIIAVDDVVVTASFGY